MTLYPVCISLSPAPTALIRYHRQDRWVERTSCQMDCLNTVVLKQASLGSPRRILVENVSCDQDKPDWNTDPIRIIRILQCVLRLVSDLATPSWPLPLRTTQKLA